MDKYRITKETKEKTGKIKYYIEYRKKLFKWIWWKKLTKWLPECDARLIFNFDSYEEAKKKLDSITEHTIKEVCDK